jgi:hypothetical protein
MDGSDLVVGDGFVGEGVGSAGRPEEQVLGVLLELELGVSGEGDGHEWLNRQRSSIVSPCTYPWWAAAPGLGPTGPSQAGRTVPGRLVRLGEPERDLWRHRQDARLDDRHTGSS